MNAALKPCPCCGGQAVLTKGFSTRDDWPQGNFHRVFCGVCQLRQLYHTSPEAARLAWNTRLAHPEATAANDSSDAPLPPGTPVTIANYDKLSADDSAAFVLSGGKQASSAQGERAALTDDEIGEVINACRVHLALKGDEGKRFFARAIEQAIKGEVK